MDMLLYTLCIKEKRYKGKRDKGDNKTHRQVRLIVDMCANGCVCMCMYAQAHVPCMSTHMQVYMDECRWINKCISLLTRKCIWMCVCVFVRQRETERERESVCSNLNNIEEKQKRCEIYQTHTNWHPIFTSCLSHHHNHIVLITLLPFTSQQLQRWQ